MKFSAFLFTLGALSSFTLNAQTCAVDLVEFGSVIDTFYAQVDQNGRCRDALRECARVRQQMGAGTNLTCQVASVVNPPAPQPPRRDVFMPMPSATIMVGEQVMEDYNTRTIQRVQAISANRYLLDDGQWYSTSYINKLKHSLNGIQLGEDVMEDYNTRSFLYVKAIADNLFLLSDDQWYSTQYVNRLERSLNGFVVGERVLEDYNTRSFATIEAISDGLFFLSDGQWYSPQYVNRLEQSYNGFYVGQTVTETYNTMSIRRIVAISDGLFLLDDGQWYNSQYINRVIR